MGVSRTCRCGTGIHILGAEVPRWVQAACRICRDRVIRKLYRGKKHRKSWEKIKRRLSDGKF